MFNKIKQILIAWVEGIVLAGIVLFSVAPVSCKVTPEGIKMLSGDYVPPVLNEFTVLSSDTLKLVFSEKVEITQGVVCPVLNPEDYSCTESSCTEDLSKSLAAAAGMEGSIPVEFKAGDNENIVLVVLNQKMQIGKLYEIYGTAKDSVGNELTFALNFSGFNSRVPKIIMTELQTASVSQSTKEKETGIARNEFVEFLVLSDGNLSGLELCSGYDGGSRAYRFPAVEVKLGEVFVVHLRARGNGCISEEEDNFALAFSGYSNDNIRDLWANDSGTALGNKTDVIVLRNRANNSILDAVMFRDEGVNSWTKEMVDLASLLDDGTIYKNGDIQNATVTAGMTDTKTLHRVAAFEILQRIMAGEAVEYPVAVENASWVVGSESHGEILQMQVIEN